MGIYLLFDAQIIIYLKFANRLDAYGFALENLAALSEISVGGGTQTGNSVILNFKSDHKF